MKLVISAFDVGDDIITGLHDQQVVDYLTTCRQLALLNKEILFRSTYAMCQGSFRLILNKVLKEPHDFTFMNAIAAKSSLRILDEEQYRASINRFEDCRNHLYMHTLSELGYPAGDASYSCDFVSRRYMLKFSVFAKKIAYPLLHTDIFYTFIVTVKFIVF